MPLWRQLLLGGYYYGSQPWRAWRSARMRAAGAAPVIVLFYHRVADTQPNPWTTSNHTFSRQIRWLKSHFDMISLLEAQRRIRSRFNGRPSIAITFDDGYADNCQAALPLLIAERIPCTYFVTAHNVIAGAPFEHDIARGKPLAPNTTKQLVGLARSGIEIGAHTRTHPDLGCISDPDRLHDEVVAARDDLEKLCGTRIRYFAFPFGQHANLNAEIFYLARDAGYDGVCSAYGGFNFPGEDAFHLQRIHVDDDMIRLKNWSTVDPRKLRSVRRYEYRSCRSECIEPIGAGA